MRTVHHGDAIDWLRARGPTPGWSIVTSLPDVSEIGASLDAWRAWFDAAAAACLGVVPDDGVAVFFQTDLRRDGVVVDKADRVARVAEARGWSLVLSKVVCRVPPGATTYGRPAFTRFVAFARRPLARPSSIPDVIVDAGRKTWTRAVGVRAVAHGVRFARAASPSTTTIVDPFCGVGTFLAVAEALGLDAIGVEKHGKRATASRALVVDAAEL